MTPENFVYWLNGFFEIANPTKLSEGQIKEIRNHIALVLQKKTPIQPNNVKWFNGDLNLPAGTGIPLGGFTPYPSGPPLKLYNPGDVSYPYGPPASC